MGLKAKSFMDAGALVPDEVIIWHPEGPLSGADCANGFILTVCALAPSHRQRLSKMGIRIDKVLELSVADDVIVNRMAAAASPVRAAQATISSTRRARSKGVCDCCGGKLVIGRDLVFRYRARPSEGISRADWAAGGPTVSAASWLSSPSTIPLRRPRQRS